MSYGRLISPIEPSYSHFDLLVMACNCIAATCSVKCAHKPPRQSHDDALSTISGADLSFYKEEKAI